MKNLISQVRKSIAELQNGAKRSDKWPTARKYHLLEQPFCKMCGSTTDLQVHHCLPFAHDPTQELVDTNLVTLCETLGIECHLKFGHLGNWKQFDPDILQIATAPAVGVPAPNYINAIPNITFIKSK